MKVSIIAVAFAAIAASATALSAYAVNPVANSSDTNASSYDAQQMHQWSPVQTTPKTKTRAEVRQELVRAEKDGQIAALSKLYQGG
ncbi:DUF4148 domain-containing protein [Paraburkholderia caffeinilytica]|uniref:DUF4148 domain-containing protein n=1 Tax=Paraburkholderia caffeinilytica TaxID=1761016 RepID=UPI0038BDCF41